MRSRAQCLDAASAQLHRVWRFRELGGLTADGARDILTDGQLATSVLAVVARLGAATVCLSMLPTLCEGDFVERGDSLLAFGLPGRGKTHIVCAIGHELIQRGYRVLFTATFALVQRLLAAKRDLRLEQELVILDGFDAVVLHDIGYVQQSREKMEALRHVALAQVARKSFRQKSCGEAGLGGPALLRT